MSNSPPTRSPLPDSSRHEIRSGVVADWSDDRDADFIPMSTAAPAAELELADYRVLSDETWHQRGEECTGFALAAIANYLIRRRHDDPDLPSVSRRMLYEMAQKFDGEMHVEGSTLRGALKGWSRVGVASDEKWPYDPNDEHGAVHGSLTLERILDGRTRPLMSYRRIKDNTIGVMQHALAEGHPLYVAARTHVGWYRLFLHDSGATIQRTVPDDLARGIHAFVIIGYNEDGFVIHNSWGPEWGHDGYALLPYDQWEWGATDTWVVHAGIDAVDSATTPTEPTASKAKLAYRDMWPHLVVLDDQGQLASRGPYEMDGGSVKTMLYLFDEYTRREKWPHRKLVVIADDGAEPTSVAIERLKPLRDELLQSNIYPIFVVWETSWRHDLEHEILTWREHRNHDSEDGDQAASELAIKIATAESRCPQIWDAIRSRSIKACVAPTGGARLLAESIAYKRGQHDFDVHGVSFGAGDILLAPLTTLLPARVNGIIAVDPATTMHDFSVTYQQMLGRGALQHLTVMPGVTHTPDSSMTNLVSQVWSLGGSAMRNAAREGLRTGEWPATPVPVLGSRADLQNDPAAKRFEEVGRITIDASPRKPKSAAQLRRLLVTKLATTLDVDQAAASSFALSRDPLTLAQATHRLGRP